MTKKYVVLIENGQGSFGAYVPDLPGCVAAAKSRKEVQRLIQEAIGCHLESMLLDGEPLPEPTTQCCEIEIDLEKVRSAVAAERAQGKETER